MQVSDYRDRYRRGRPREIDGGGLYAEHDNSAVPGFASSKGWKFVLKTRVGGGVTMIISAWQIICRDLAARSSLSLAERVVAKAIRGAEDLLFSWKYF